MIPIIFIIKVAYGGGGGSETGKSKFHVYL